MTREVHIHRAEAMVGAAPVDPVAIHIDRDQPTSEYAAEASAMFKADGKALADALWESLPGGTLSELTAELLERRACQFRVRMPQEIGR